MYQGPFEANCDRGVIRKGLASAVDECPIFLPRDRVQPDLAAAAIEHTI